MLADLKEENDKQLKEMKNANELLEKQTQDLT